MSTETKEVPKEFVIYVRVAVCCICGKPAAIDAEVVDGDIICKPCMEVVNKLTPHMKCLKERIDKNGTTVIEEVEKMVEQVKADDPNVPFRSCSGCNWPQPREEVKEVNGKLLCKGCNKQ